MASKDNKIRWKKSDWLTLGRAVSNFNKKIRELQSEERKLYLPEEIKYGEIKKEILTRAKLNDILRSLRSFNQETAQPVFTYDKSKMITKWESQENIIKSNRAVRNLTLEAKEINKSLTAARQKSGRISSKKQQELKMQYLEVLEDLRDIKKARTSSELPYVSYKNMISKLGNLDYKMLKATVYRENFEHALESYKNYEGYQLLKDKLDRINNPVYFYNYVRRSEYFKDIFIHYKEGEGVVVTFTPDDEEEQNPTQAKFSEAIEQLGLVEEEKRRLVKRFKKEGNEQWLKNSESISGADDLFIVLDYIKKQEEKK